MALLAAGVSGAQAPAESASAPVAVRSIRYWSLGQVTRVAVELTGEARFRTETLVGPDRFFVDIFDSRLEMGDRRPQTIRINDALVRQVRVASADSRTRVVLDLNRKLESEVSQLANPHRIMIEVRVPGSGKAAIELTTPSRTGGERLDKPRPAETSAQEPPKAPPAKAESVKAASSKPEPEKPDPAPAAPRAEPAAEPAAAPPKSPEGAVTEGVPLAAAPKPAKPRAGGQQSLVRALGLKLGKVVIDAGHGGHDHGTTGPTGLIEKEFVLDVALRLGALIEEKLGSEVVYTRTTDIFIPLEERTAVANKHKADLFISVHANSSPYKSISGAEVYYLNFTTSKNALEVAARENAGHGKSIFELKDLIQKIALKDKVDESREFAAKLQKSLHGTWAKMNGSARDRGVKKAPFIVLIGASMPSVLAEIGFLSNPRDEQTLRKPESRQKLAEALFRGMQQYASTLSEMRVASTGASVVESR
jgi:N-acetylmuramoyl-L-alanine amidase